MTLAAVVTWVRGGILNGKNGKANPRLESAFARFETAHAENARVRRELVGTVVIAREESARAHELAMAVLRCECEDEESEPEVTPNAQA